LKFFVQEDKFLIQDKDHHMGNQWRLMNYCSESVSEWTLGVHRGICELDIANESLQNVPVLVRIAIRDLRRQIEDVLPRGKVWI
jgi:hypothetical protein